MDLMPRRLNSLIVVAMLALLGRDMASKSSVTQWLQQEEMYDVNNNKFRQRWMD